MDSRAPDPTPTAPARIADVPQGMARARREVPRWALAFGYLVVCLAAVELDAWLLGPHGLGWRRTPHGGGGGAALTLLWGWFVAARLGRGASWPRALAGAVPIALLLWGAATVLVHLVYGT